MRLSRQRTLVHFKVRRRTQENAIGRNGGEIVTVDREYISNDNVIVNHRECLAVANDQLGVGVVQRPRESQKGKLLGVVNAGRDEHDDADRDENGGSFNPAGGALFAVAQLGGYFNGEVDAAEDNEHDQDKVLHRFPTKLEEAVEFLFGNGVGSKDLSTTIDVGGVNAALGAGLQQETSHEVGSQVGVLVLVGVVAELLGQFLDVGLDLGQVGGLFGVAVVARSGSNALLQQVGEGLAGAFAGQSGQIFRCDRKLASTDRQRPHTGLHGSIEASKARVILFGRHGTHNNNNYERGSLCETLRLCETRRAARSHLFRSWVHLSRGKTLRHSTAK